MVTKSFLKYLISFVVLLVVSFSLLLATGYLGARSHENAGEATCITSSGTPC